MWLSDRHWGCQVKQLDSGQVGLGINTRKAPARASVHLRGKAWRCLAREEDILGSGCWFLFCGLINEVTERVGFGSHISHLHRSFKKKSFHQFAPSILCFYDRYSSPSIRLFLLLLLLPPPHLSFSSSSTCIPELFISIGDWAADAYLNQNLIAIWPLSRFMCRHVPCALAGPPPHPHPRPHRSPALGPGSLRGLDVWRKRRRRGRRIIQQWRVYNRKVSRPGLFIYTPYMPSMEHYVRVNTNSDCVC